MNKPRNSRSNQAGISGPRRCHSGHRPGIARAGEILLAANRANPKTLGDFGYELLDHLTDEVGQDEQHPLASLMDVVGVLIEKYEDDHVPELVD